MKYALIGCGRISPNHIVAAQKNGLEIVAICDLEMRNMKDKFLKFRLSDTVQCYTDHGLMLEKEKPDLIAIATESGKHAQIALDCMTIGHANLIIEKPIALSLADADAIIETARRENLKVCACDRNGRRFGKRWRWSASAGCSTVRRISGGREIMSIIPGQSGAARGSRMAVR